MYSSRYLTTSGQIYWADSQLSAAYVDDYHARPRPGARREGQRQRDDHGDLRAARQARGVHGSGARALRERRANVIYGTVRLIEQDDETVLAWARERYACVIFNLHIDHTPAAIDAAADAFRALIDLGIEHGGSYYLTYHRWARRDQVERAHPQMREFLALKRRHDPDEVFQHLGTASRVPS